MFWRFGFHSFSTLESLLDKGDVTLEEVLDEEEVLQECKTHNKKLVQFLCEREILAKMVNYLVQEPPSDLDEKVKFKYPNLCCEVLTCDIWAFCESLFANRDLLQTLWSFLKNPAPLNPLLASYFSKVFSHLLHKKTFETFHFIRSQPNALDDLLNHMGTSAIMELILKSITCEQEGDIILEYYKSERLVPRLITLLNPANDVEVHSNAGQAFLDILAISESRTDLLRLHFRNEEMIAELLTYMFEVDRPNATSTLINGIQIINEILRRSLGQYSDGRTDDLEFVSNVVMRLIPYLDTMQEFLARPRSLSPADYSKTLSHERLMICELLVELLHTRSIPLIEKFAEHKVFCSCLNLFFDFPWNNFMHTLVLDMILTVFNTDIEISKGVIISLFKDAKVTERIAKAQRDNDAECTRPKGTRLGYMGHLTVLAESIVKLVETYRETLEEPLQEYLQQEAWLEYVNKSLKETKERDRATLGGARPIIQNNESEDEDILDHTVDGETRADQYVRFLCQQITDGVPEKFGFDDDDDQDEEEGDDDVNVQMAFTNPVGESPFFTPAFPDDEEEKSSQYQAVFDAKWPESNDLGESTGGPTPNSDLDDADEFVSAKTSDAEDADFADKATPVVLLQRSPQLFDKGPVDTGSIHLEDVEYSSSHQSE